MLIRSKRIRLKPILNVWLRFPIAYAHSNIEKIDDDLKQYMHGRKFSERRDSISKTILMERKKHQAAFELTEADPKLIKSIVKLRLGEKKQMANLYAQVASQYHTLGGVLKQTNIAAGGFSEHVASASKDWPVFKHLLPEVVFAGHSNSGKSTLVNALSGVLPRKGPAGIDERAGWTDQICFYQLGKKPPVLTLVDFPGYGHAIASVEDRKDWIRMTRNYLANRMIISRCCILVDATRGLCSGDRSLMRYLNRIRVPWLIIMTKGDLLGPEDLAKSIQIVRNELVGTGLISVEALNEEEHDNETNHELDSTNINASSIKIIESKSGDSSQVNNSISIDQDSSSSDSDCHESGLTYDDEDDFLENEPQSTVKVKPSKNKGKNNNKQNHGKKQKEEESSIEDQDGVIIIPVSANTGAGVDNLWSILEYIVSQDVNNNTPAHAVKEHRNANLLRRQDKVNRMVTNARNYTLKMIKKPRIKT